MRKIDLVHDNVNISVSQVPQYRMMHAKDYGNLKRLLMHTFAGIGDQVCAEPTLRYAIKCRDRGEIDKLALASPMPELFAHLPFDKVFDKGEQYDKKEWFDFYTAPNTTPSLASEFVSQGLTNCVDYISIHAFRMQLPTKDREILLSSRNPTGKIEKIIKENKTIVVHPGKHWPSKTFPKWWWDKVLGTIVDNGITPIIIGSDMDNRRTVDVNTEGCYDLRNMTMLDELAWILQRCTVLLSNDSSPIHFAASSDPNDYENSGNAWIGMIPTCKHFDYITHYRKGIFQWREENFSHGGMWDIHMFIPNKMDDTRIDDIDEKTLVSWLPDPRGYAEWAVEKCQ